MIQPTHSRISRSVSPYLSAAFLAGTVAMPAAAGVEVTERLIESSVDSEQGAYRVVQVVDGLEHPWAIAWLPDGRMLVTERAGRLQLVDGDDVTAVDGLPPIHADEDQRTAPQGGGQGGLLDVAVHPDYEENGWIYFTYSSPGDPDTVTSGDQYGTATALARARLSDDGSKLVDRETLYAQMPRHNPGRHYGSRILFPGDGTVLFSIGDRGIRSPSQDLTDPAGSIIRINEDGNGVPDDNPFVGADPGNLRPEIYSYGHRNNQGLAINHETGEIWATEHGPSGGDMLHRIAAGGNYGWPQVAFGREYTTGEKIGIGQHAPGVISPVYWYEQSMAPSGLVHYTGDAIPGWQGSLFAGSLVRRQLHRLEIADGEVAHKEVLLDGTLGRIRDVRQGPDGLLYVTTDESDAGVYRLEPAD